METDSATTDIIVGAISLSNHITLRKSLLAILLSKLAHAIFDQSAGISIDERWRGSRRAMGCQNDIRILL